MRAPAVVATLCALAFGSAACGGGGESASTSTSAPTATQAPSSGGATAPEETATTTAPTATTGGAAAPDGASVVADNGCKACHQLPGGGSPGPGPDLTAIGAELDAGQIEATLVQGPGSMPSFAKLKSDSPEDFQAMVDYLAGLKG